jgi:hypothetical protein
MKQLLLVYVKCSREDIIVHVTARLITDDVFSSCPDGLLPGFVMLFFLSHSIGLGDGFLVVL